MEPLVALFARDHAVAFGLPADTVQLSGVDQRHSCELVVSEHNILLWRRELSQNPLLLVGRGEPARLHQRRGVVLLGPLAALGGLAFF